MKTVRRNMRTRGKLQRDFGHVRTRHRQKSHQLLEQTLHRWYDGVGRNVQLTTCVFGVTSKCQTSSTNYCADATLVQRGQVVVVVTVALR